MIGKNGKNSIIYSAIGLLFVFLLWFLLYFVVANSYIVPSPLLVIKESFYSLLNGEFYAHLLSTVLRVLIALLISLVLGTALSLISHLSKKVESVLIPIISITRSLPVLAVLLIILIIAPRGVAPIIVCILSILPIIYSQTLNYLNTIDLKTKQMLSVYNVPLKKQVIKVYLKGYSPLFVKEITSLFSFSLKLVVSAEILASVYKSIGGDISNASIYSNVTQLFSLTLIVCLIGIAVELIGNLVSNKMEKKYK
ncbi:MAG: ABC transporter permease subunit [Clostridia bacterium]|nr:ABC transporter permease subunit [Clostridia bacterium]